MLQSIQNLSLIPIKQIGPIQDLPGEDISILHSVKIRLLFVAQILVTSLVLPIIILVGFLERAIDFCKGEDNETITTLGNFIRYHLIYVIPGSLVGITLPVITAKSCLAALELCYKDTAVALRKIEAQVLLPTLDELLTNE